MATTTRKKATKPTIKQTATGRCEIVVLLDRSGSMSTIKNDMEKGFDHFVAEQRKVPGECTLTLVQFDTQGIDTVHEAKPLADVPALKLEPRGGTPLLDAMGQTLTRSKARIGALDAAVRPARVVFLVLTDGEENSSREFKKDQIKKLVEQATADGWGFIYLGANVDAFAEAGSVGINTVSAASFTPDSVGVQHAYNSASANLASYRTASTPTAAVAALSITPEQRKKMAGKKA